MMGVRKGAGAQGNMAQYPSGTHSAWVLCKVQAVDPGSGAVMLDVKPDHWLSVADQQVLLAPATTGKEGDVAGVPVRIGQQLRCCSSHQGTFSVPVFPQTP